MLRILQIVFTHNFRCATVVFIPLQGQGIIIFEVFLRHYSVCCKWFKVELSLLCLQVSVLSKKMPVKVTKDEFGVTTDGTHIAR